LPAYVVGSVLGALLAAISYDVLARPRDADAAAEPAQGTQGDIVGRREGGQSGEPPSRAGRRRSTKDVRAQRRG
jgi:hypothetical protein